MMSRQRKQRPIVATRDMVRRKRRRRAIAVLLLLALTLGAVVYGTWRYIDEQEFLLDERCEVQLGEVHHELSPDQAANAALIAAAAVERGLPPQAATHGVAISLQESNLEVLEATDEYDARELFASGGPDWSGDEDPDGVATSVQDFYDALQSAQGREEDSWTPELDVDDAAEVLNRPHDASFYSRHADRARAFAGPLTGQQPVGMTCHLTRKDAPPADADTLAEDLSAVLANVLAIPESDPDDEDAPDYGDALTVQSPETASDGGAVTVRIPESEENGGGAASGELWTVAHWAVATADVYGTQTVHAGAYQWSRATGVWERVEDVSDDVVTIGF